MEHGIAVGYKVVWTLAHWISPEVRFYIYSSETGLWKTEKVHCVRPLIWYRMKYSVPLNGILHWLASIDNDVDANHIVSYDFYSGGDDDLECRVIPFPGELYEQNRRFKRTITTSAGSVVYCNVFNDNGGCTIRVWRLVNYCNGDPMAAWNVTWELNTNTSLVRFGIDYFPVVMHPFNSEIIYLWSKNKNGLVLLNLRTHKFSLHKEDEENNKCIDGCIMRLSGVKEYMDSIYSVYVNAPLGGNHNLHFSQFVLHRWLNPLPKLAS